MNKSGDENRSVRNTKKRLKESLVFLMQKKSVNSISVKELTDLADVNRGTFYLHYSDIYDMVQKIEDEFFAEYESVLNTSTPSGEKEGYIYLKELFTFFKNNQDFCRLICSTNADLGFFNRLKNLLNRKYCIVWENAELQMSRKQTEYYNSFIFWGSIGILKQWIDNDFNESPEAVARLVAKIIYNSARGFNPMPSGAEKLNDFA